VGFNSAFKWLIEDSSLLTCHAVSLVSGSGRFSGSYVLRRHGFDVLET